MEEVKKVKRESDRSRGETREPTAILTKSVQSLCAQNSKYAPNK